MQCWKCKFQHDFHYHWKIKTREQHIKNQKENNPTNPSSSPPSQDLAVCPMTFLTPYHLATNYPTPIPPTPLQLSRSTLPSFMSWFQQQPYGLDTIILLPLYCISTWVKKHNNRLSDVRRNKMSLLHMHIIFLLNRNNKSKWIPGSYKDYFFRGNVWAIIVWIFEEITLAAMSSASSVI